MNSKKGNLGIGFLVLCIFAGMIYSQPPKDPKWQANWYQVNWEREKFEKKIPTDTIYIHHTSHAVGITWQELSDLQLKTLYVPRYNSADPDPLVKGMEPYSGHFRYNISGVLIPVFYAYHWLVRADGKSADHLLEETDVGWHVGN